MKTKTVEERWVEGIPHHHMSISLISHMKAVVNNEDLSVDLRTGGDGDPGEELMLMMDSFFENSSSFLLGEEQAWLDLRDAGLLWWINRSLHIVGWAIEYVFDAGRLIRVTPRRVKYRGFGRNAEELGFQMLTQYLAGEVGRLKKDVEG